MHAWNDDRIFERTAIGLASLGHKVTYIAPCEKDISSNGVEIKAIPIRGRLGKHLISPLDAYRKMQAEQADIYHFFNPNMMLLMRRWARKGNRTVIDIHENYEVRVVNLFPRIFSKFLSGFYRILENYLCRSFSGVTVVTKSMAEKLSTSRTPILILDNVPYLKSLEDIELSDKRDIHPTIITSGTHSEARNCAQAIEALSIIMQKIPEVRMKFVGRFQPPEYERVLKEHAMNFGVESSVIFEGMLTWKDNFIRLSKAHIGCVFYNDNLNNRVTLPNRLYEYMYCGLPVLGEDFKEVRDVINSNNCGAVVNSRDPSDIANKAVALLSDENKYRTLSENARKAVFERHNFESALDGLEKFYLELLAC